MSRIYMYKKSEHEHIYSIPVLTGLTLVISKRNHWRKVKGNMVIAMAQILFSDTSYITADHCLMNIYKPDLFKIWFSMSKKLRSLL